MAVKSKLHELISATIVFGLLGFGAYKGVGEFREGRRGREIEKALDRGDFSFAVQRYDEYAKQGLLDEDDLAQFEQQFSRVREQIGGTEKHGIQESLNKAIEELRPQWAGELVQKAANTGFFDTTEIDRMKAKLAPLQQESFWYTRITNLPAELIPEVTSRYIQRFPDGEHRDMLITQHLSLAYRNAQQAIMDRDVVASLAGITTLTQEFEKPWVAQPRWKELLDARKEFRNRTQALIDMATSPSDKYLPGVPVRVIASKGNWKEEYREQRDQNIGIGSVGVVDAMAPSNGTENDKVCVNFPDLQIKWENDWSGPCTKGPAPHRAEYQASEIQRFGLTVAERSRIRVLLDNLERTERLYFGD